VQPVVELVGGEEAAFVEQFPDGGKVGGGDDRSSEVGIFRPSSLSHLLCLATRLTIGSVWVLQSAFTNERLSHVTI